MSGEYIAKCQERRKGTETRGKQENIINACTYDYYPASDALRAYYATYAARKTTAVHALPRLLCTFLS